MILVTSALIAVLYREPEAEPLLFKGLDFSLTDVACVV